MYSDKTDRLIAEAVAALPYRRPAPDFSARVMADITAEPAAGVWRTRALKTAALIVSAWSAMLAFAAAAFVYIKFSDIAAIVIQPGGVAHFRDMTAARLVLIMDKLISAVSMASSLAGAAGLCPAAHDAAAAAVICSVVVFALSRGRSAGHHSESLIRR